MSSILEPLKQSEGAIHRQVTAHLRNLINSGKLKPRTRLPTDRDLAKQWGTNNHTIHRALTPLVAEGLIERLRKRGTFVRDRNKHIASVALYFGGNLWHHENAFYQHMFHRIESQYEQRKIRCSLFVDSRPDREKAVALPALQKAIDQGEIQGVIALMISNQEGWLRRLQLPLSLFGTGGVQTNRMEFFELVLSRLKAEGCKTVGVIFPRLNQEWHMVFQTVAKRRGLKLDPVWTGGGRLLSDPSPDFTGYRLFKERWSRRKHPDGLFVYPDVVCRGVTIAALELGVRIPRDLRLIFHRNTGIDFLCPWKIPFLVIDVQEAAQHLMDYVEAQFRHEFMPLPIIRSKLIDF